MRVFFIITIFFISSFVGLSQIWNGFPLPQKIDKNVTLFNIEIQDPYFWMRHKDSIYVLNHLQAENEYANSQMEKSKLLRLKLYEEFKSRMSAESVNLPTPRDSFNYYSRYEKGQDFPLIFRKSITKDTSTEELVFDMNSLKKQFLFFIPALFNVSPNHQWFAYGVDDNGDRDMKLFFQKIGNEKALDESIERASGMVWASDNEHIYYLLSDPITKRQNQIYRYKLGTSKVAATLVMEENNPEYQLGMSRSSSGDYIFISAAKTDTTELFVIDANDSNAKPIKIINRNQGLDISIDHAKDKRFYLISNQRGANYGIYSSNSLENKIDSWVSIVPPKKDSLLSSFTITADYIVLDYLADARYISNLYTKDGEFIKILGDNKLLQNTNCSNPYNYELNKIRINTSDYTNAEKVFDYYLNKDSLKLIYEDTIKFDYNPEDYVAKRIYVTARDGEEIPVSLMYKKDINLKELNPLHLMGYGAYGVTLTPSFSRNRLSYLNRGFLVAIAHIRGSSAKGSEWHDKGKMLNKLNSFNDFIDVAKFFQDSGYTSPELTVIQGGSAGGLLVGASLNIAPEVFGCAIANVPFVDVINTMLDDQLPLTTFEYLEWGNPNKKEEFEYIYKYSPYDNIKAQNYPPILATSGYHDSQVGYWEPAKWVARLRDFKTDTNAILFTTNMKSGHTGASGRYESLKESAFEMAFVLKTLGYTENYVSINGQVVDPMGNGFPLCNILIEGSSNGTITNEEGFFSLDIREDQNLKLIFSAIGFDKKVINLDPASFSGELQVQMTTKDILLREVEVSAKAKDPAYGIIKKAIESRKKREAFLNGFETDIYIKNTGRLNDIPEKLPFIFRNATLPDSNDLGLIGITESIAKYYFQKPNNSKEEMTASIKSGSQSGFSWNRASDVLFDFYQNHIHLEYYSQRPFLSPIANTALLNYKFELEGVFYEGEQAINRIKVSPRRKGDPLFSGYIDIRENHFDIYGLDLMLTKDAQIEFVDTVWLKQNFVEVDGIMMPLQVQMSSNIEFLGFKGVDLTVGNFTNYKLNQEYSNKFFSRQIFAIADNANKKNDSFWDKQRGTILTEEESTYYIKADSIQKIESSPAYYDSVYAKMNKPKISKFLLTGYTYSKRRGDTISSFSINSLLDMLRFDPVQGLNPYLSFGMNKRFLESRTNYYFGFSGGYSIEEQKPNFVVNFNHNHLPTKFGSYGFGLKSTISQYNDEQPVPLVYDMSTSLFNKQNFANLLRTQEISAFYRTEIVNGLIGKLSIAATNNSFVDNNTEYSFSNKTNPYNPQAPVNAFLNNTSFNDYSRLRSRFEFTYQFNQKYELLPNQKYTMPGKAPLLYFGFEHLQGIRESGMNKQLIELGAGKDIDFKMFGTLKIDINSGLFLNARNLAFPDYHHFRGNEIVLLIDPNVIAPDGVSRSRNLQFATLEYYRLSTINNFVQLHAYHNFQGFLLGKIPLIRKMKWNALAGYNGLITGNQSHQEVFIGIANILKVLRIDFAAAYVPGAPLKPAVRIGLGGFAF